MCRSLLDLTKVREVSEVVCRASGYTLDAWKPLVGENLFVRESGAVASQFHIPEAIEPYSSELVDARRSIVLGKKSGLDTVDLKGKELGLAIALTNARPFLPPSRSTPSPNEASDGPGISADRPRDDYRTVLRWDIFPSISGCVCSPNRG